jgi:hypothetical protein
MGGMDTSEELDALFAVPLEDFTAERDRIAKELSASGEKDAARAVKSIRKPSIVVWTLNQLARTGSERLRALFETGENMRRSLEAGDGKGARREQADRRSKLKRLGDDAADILRAGGHAASSGHIEKIRSILLQATTDHDVARSISEGRLTTEPSGDALPDVFGDVGSGLGEASDEALEDAPAVRRRRRLEERIEKLRTEAEAASQEAARLARDAESARLTADAAEDVANAAQRAAERALNHLEDAEKELRALR